MRTNISPNNTAKLYKIPDLFWFDTLKSRVDKFPEAYSQEGCSNWCLLRAAWCIVSVLVKWWIRGNSKKRGEKKWFNVDFRQCFLLHICRIGHKFEHNHVNVALFICTKTQGTWFNFSRVAGQHNKLQEIFSILSTG